LKASPERISYVDQDGTRHTSVAYILSLEIGGTDLRTLVANMTEPARLLSEGHPTIELSRGAQYVVRESDAERSAEISDEFYPTNEGPLKTLRNLVWLRVRRRSSSPEFVSWRVALDITTRRRKC
jgi:hypothetical protein